MLLVFENELDHELANDSKKPTFLIRYGLKQWLSTHGDNHCLGWRCESCYSAFTAGLV